MRSLVLPSLLALVLAACADLDGPSGSELHRSASVPPWSVVTFGVTRIDVPALFVDPKAINDLGQVAGRQGGPNGAFLWANGTTQLLTGEDDNAASVGSDLNAFGLVVGHGGSHASAWEDGGYTMLAPFEPDGGAAATAVNDAGLIVGTDQPLDPDNPRLGLVWRDKTQTPLLLQGADARPADVNNAGIIVGAVRFVVGENPDAALWSSLSAAPQRLKGFGGGVCGAPANAVSERGEIAGRCRVTGNLFHAAYWAHRDAEPEDLGPTGLSSDALDINELGQLLGTAVGETFAEVHPMLWVKEAGRFRALDLGLPDGTTRAFAAALNNMGQAVGTADDQGISGHAFLWRIPMQAALDVAPESPSNKVRLGGGGTLSVVILGSRWFRATGVDPALLTLGDESGLDTPIARSKFKPLSKLADVNRDGFTDLVADFTKRDLIANGDLAVGTRTLILLGRTRDGGHVRGTDVAQVGP